MHDVVIAGAVRTPIGALGGALSKIRPDDLAAHVHKGPFGAQLR
jgi:acetyl-CoA acetyltransferase